MIDVKFSSVHGYVLIYCMGEVYLVNTIYNMSLFSLSKPPEKVTLDTYLLDQQAVSYFEAGNNKKMSSVSAVLLTQPLVAIIYNLGMDTFQNFNASKYIAIKALLLFISIFITLLSSRIYLKSLKKKIPNHFVTPNNHFSLRTYKPKDKICKRNFFKDGLGFLLMIVLVGTPLYLYFKINNGGESILLMVVSAIVFILYVSTKMSPIAAPAYKDYDFIITKNDN
ncbi:hypothetical protein ACQUMI_001869 [Enterococcus faecalis]|uniref:hypothetical protein n=1 Tax=Enterococcus faecalis TaxID=1351 RepID=UPI0019FA2202|nr:hypothetical protein [Enterococcus faecalis]EGO2596461.1 hypothetical protein [Enterococcus faecalis]EGO2806968.1 hypothetical protein [Enterococcus faecalis]EGO6609487.1 hypothetical protein [Enterococcus faecalis]EGO9793935.1 hypothetical protein [Enterococcus faecalis]EIX2408204.1 hypothetical protein [Enterococcus faecalis]